MLYQIIINLNIHYFAESTRPLKLYVLAPDFKIALKLLIRIQKNNEIFKILCKLKRDQRTFMKMIYQNRICSALDRDNTL